MISQIVPELPEVIEVSLPFVETERGVGAALERRRAKKKRRSQEGQ
jgi:hypothetical protein